MELVSVIIPVFNCEKYITHTLDSLLNQTYKNWEAILVDDCSTDTSAKIINEYEGRDARIKYYRLTKNSGAAVARNYGLMKSEGRFIAYLDSDDIWLPFKLERQVKFMLDNKFAFTCTDYEVIADNGISKKKIVNMPNSITYHQYLRNTIIQTVTVVIDLHYIEKKILEMPNIRRRQDAATWLKILSSGYKCYGLNECLSYYRRTEGSLSSNKIKAVKGTWYLYRKIEKISFIKSLYYFIGYAFNATLKRIYIKEKLTFIGNKNEGLY